MQVDQLAGETGDEAIRVLRGLVDAGEITVEEITARLLQPRISAQPAAPINVDTAEIA